MKYVLLVLSLGSFIFSILTLTDFRAGRRNIFRKHKVKENSFWRKILPFKETENNPFTYAKLIPILVQGICFIGTIIFYIIFWVSPNLIEPFFERWEYYLLSIMVILPQMLYSAILMI